MKADYHDAFLPLSVMVKIWGKKHLCVLYLHGTRDGRGWNFAVRINLDNKGKRLSSMYGRR